SRTTAPAIDGEFYNGFDAVNPQRRHSVSVDSIGGTEVPVVIATDSNAEYNSDSIPDKFADKWFGFVELTAPCSDEQLHSIPENKVVVLTSNHPNYQAAVSAAIHRMTRLGIDNPVVIRVSYQDTPADKVMLKAAVDLGVPVMNGLADGLWIESDSMTPAELSHLAFGILQSARLRITRTEYIACPGCGRTLFNLESTLKKVKEATSSLKGLKIGVMGCIVNGPGEMADADYGYVGAGVGKVSLYKGKECIEKNIPEQEAVKKLIDFIEKDRK
ncbi:MAG: flavodoxin-dependent (E)-4-hydroxy-3-methylbut-2-enyl-diphosphate synthase, partial [Paramuribaculum sp.]|nr:flavodoxin-dependent (E)-4-hydroxy-3-methylbut-2-enyl-diphosphate synthase [Paramuribaculum sp.]